MFDSIKYNKKSCLLTEDNKTKQDTTSRRGGQSPSPARVVSFSQNDKRIDEVAIYHIPSRLDMSKREIQETWYNEYEHRDMKRACVMVLRKMIAGTLSKYEIDETRGLENKTPQGSDARKRNRFVALFAVLEEQDRQREDGRAVDSDYIAQLYHQSTAQCQRKAVLIAENDAKIVRNRQGKIQTGGDGEKDVLSSFTSTTSTTTKNISSDNKTSKIVSPMVRSSSLTCIASPYKVRSRRRLLTMLN